MSDEFLECFKTDEAQVTIYIRYVGTTGVIKIRSSSDGGGCVSSQKS